MFQLIKRVRRLSVAKRYFAVGSDNGGIDIDNPEEIENLENNYNDLYLRLHQSNAVPNYKLPTVGSPKEYRTVGEYAETVQRSLSDHLKNPDKEYQESGPSIASAEGRIFLGRENLAVVLEAENKARSVMTVAEIAGIMAAKKTRDLIPESYSSNVTKVSISVSVQPETSEVLVRSTVDTSEGDPATEAVLACSVALVTIFDHFKTENIKQLSIGNIKLLR